MSNRIDSEATEAVPSAPGETNAVEADRDMGPEEFESGNTSTLVVRNYLRGGPTLLDAHRKGGRLTQRQAILAKCADCMNNYVDGREDCRITACPLYPWMPYRGRGATA